MQFQVNPGDELPIYRQIMHQITDAIVAGRIEPGDKLASHRDLAAQLVVAPLTVKKAYDELEREGLLHTQRGRGTFVSDTPPAVDSAETRKRLRESAQRLLTQARRGGVSYGDVVDLIDEIWKEMGS
jgi:GntR family transcriptional regulator